MRIPGGLAALVTVAVLLTGCGTAQPSAGASANPDLQPALQRALAAWADFPVGASPRPLVLPGGDDQVVASASFAVANGDQKLAFGQGAIDPPATLPSAPTEADGYSMITAEQAFRELSRGNGQSLTSTRIQTTSATLGIASFGSDRGPRQLPAWLFTFVDVSGWQAVLAVAPTGIYPLPAPLTSQPGVGSVGGVELGPDGRTLTVEMAGVQEGTGPCEAQYSSLQVASSDTAVAIAYSVRLNPVPSDMACPAQAMPVRLSTVLAAPLAARVVVNAQAQPVGVTPSS